VQAFEFEISTDRKQLEEIVDLFFPVIEQRILADSSFAQSPSYTQVMVLICKIFYICN
jgi:hypothetical protein